LEEGMLRDVKLRLEISRRRKGGIVQPRQRTETKPPLPPRIMEIFNEHNNKAGLAEAARGIVRKMVSGWTGNQWQIKLDE